MLPSHKANQLKAEKSKYNKALKKEKKRRDSSWNVKLNYETSVKTYLHTNCKYKAFLRYLNEPISALSFLIKCIVHNEAR